MKKILISILILLGCVLLGGCAKNDKESVLKNMEKKVDKSKGYQLTGTMELINNENKYEYDIVVSYKKKDNYRVSLNNKMNNHEQIILKNKKGTYVLTPSLNKNFKFQSRWPYNNSQAYLPQSVINDINEDDKSTMKKDKKYFIFESKVNYKNNVMLEYQKVYVDKNYNIKKVYVYDSDDNKKIVVKFSSVDMKARFNDKYFSLEENMNTFEGNEKEEKTISNAVYPMYLPEGTYLDSEKTVNKEYGTRIILTFAGNNPFMLIEEASKASDDNVVIPTSGDLDMIEDVIAIIDDTSITWSSGGIDYYLVSNDLDSKEMISVASSIATMPVGK